MKQGSAEGLSEGFWNVIPKIKTLSFDIKGKMKVTFCDGRIIVAPLSAFPSIKKLTLQQRKKWYLFGNGFSFDDCNEVLHIEQILGNSENYRHEGNKDVFLNKTCRSNG